MSGGHPTNPETLIHGNRTARAGGAHRSSTRVLTLVLALVLTLPAGSVESRVRATTIKGRIVAVDTQLPVAGALVKIEDFGRARTKKNGRYTLRSKTAATGRRRVTIRAAGLIPRETSIDILEAGIRHKANWNLLPRSSDYFDVDLLDELARPGGVIRWSSAPAFRIVRNRIECRGALFPNESCPEWIATTQSASPTVLAWLRTAIEQSAAFTGFPAGGHRWVEIDLPAGQPLDVDTLLVDGTFTVGEIVGPFATSFPSFVVGQAIETRALFLSSQGGTSEWALRRNLARGLGFIGGSAPTELCDQLGRRGMVTFFCPNHGQLAPTRIDEVLGRALYTRPIGNRSPDKDPS